MQKTVAAIGRYSFNRVLSGWLFLILTFIAIARGLQHFYIIDVHERFQYTLWWHIPFNLTMWWSWFLFVPFLFWIVVHFSTGKRRLIQWPVVYFLLPIAIIVIRQTTASVITSAVLADKSDFYALLQWRLFRNPWLWLDLIVYFAVVIGIRIVEEQQRSRRTEVRLEQLQTLLAHSQLNALRSQLHPHFLFNTLNTISTLILKADNAEADRMLSLLQNFLRTTVFENARQEIPLGEELRFIRDYLEIEKVRFKDRLVVAENVPRDTMPALVPGFLLQPVVENAIYHGIAAKTSGGRIAISSLRENGNLVVIVEDNGPGLTLPARKKNREGVGLKNTRERLQHLFGDRHRFVLENAETGGLRVTIAIPFTSAAEETVE